MAKLPRVLARIFGSAAPSTAGNQIGQVGSLAANSPTTYTGATLLGSATDIANLTSLSNFASGLGSVVVGSESIPLQDLNGLFFHNTYQLSYLMQQGIAEWETNTVYYTGSLVNDGSGNVYASLADSNVGNALTDNTKWRLIVSAVASPITRTILTSTTNPSTYTLPTGCRAIKVRAVGGGGGGGGAVAASSNQTAIGGGGGGGVYGEVLITSPASSYTYYCGSGGYGGSNAGGDAGEGGQTSFGSLLLPPGAGGLGVTSSTGTAMTVMAVGGGVFSSPDPSGWDIIIPGQNGGSPIYYGIQGSDVYYTPGTAGGSALSGWCGPNTPVGLPTLDGPQSYAGGSGFGTTYWTSYGAGGSGATNIYGGATGQPGGAGVQGVIIIDEYY